MYSFVRREPYVAVLDRKFMDCYAYLSFNEPYGLANSQSEVVLHSNVSKYRKY